MISKTQLRTLACRLERACQSGSRYGWRRCRQGLASVLDLMFPPACAACSDTLPGEARTPLLCDRCLDGLQFRREAACARCAAIMPPGVLDGERCPECRRRDFVFERAWAVGDYRGKLRDVVLRTKRSGHEYLALQLGHLLADSLERDAWGRWGDLIIPVPSHWWRRWTRGMNGPELLGEALGNRWGATVATRVLRCRRRTRKQGTLLPDERQRNVRGAFVVARPSQVCRRNVLLVDDVMTTGATVNEAAKVLLKAGAASVRIAVLARGGSSPDK